MWIRLREERARREHDRPGGNNLPAVAGADAGHPALLQDQVFGGRFENLQIARFGQRGLHGLPVELAVCLGAGSTNG